MTKIGEPKSFSEGLVSSEDSHTGKCGYLNRAGQVQIGPQYDFCDSFEEGLALVDRENDTDTPDRYFIDQTGQKVSGKHIGEGARCSHGLAVVKDSGEATYVDHSGQPVRVYKTK